MIAIFSHGSIGSFQTAQCLKDLYTDIQKLNVRALPSHLNFAVSSYYNFCGTHYKLLLVISTLFFAHMRMFFQIFQKHIHNQSEKYPLCNRVFVILSANISQEEDSLKEQRDHPPIEEDHFIFFNQLLQKNRSSFFHSINREYQSLGADLENKLKQEGLWGSYSSAFNLLSYEQKLEMYDLLSQLFLVFSSNTLAKHKVNPLIVYFFLNAFLELLKEKKEFSLKDAVKYFFESRRFFHSLVFYLPSKITLIFRATLVHLLIVFEKEIRAIDYRDLIKKGKLNLGFSAFST